MTTKGIILEDIQSEKMTVIIEKDGVEIDRFVKFAFIEMMDGVIKNPWTGVKYKCDWIGSGWDTGTITSLMTIWESEEVA